MTKWIVLQILLINSCLSLINCDQDTIGGDVVEFVNLGNNWFRANDDCLKNGMELLYPYNDVEHKQIIALQQKHQLPVVWIAASNFLRDLWTWTNNGTMIRMDYWSSGQPDVYKSHKNCMVYGPAATGNPERVWADEKCIKEHSYFCRHTKRGWNKERDTQSDSSISNSNEVYFVTLVD